MCVCVSGEVVLASSSAVPETLDDCCDEPPSQSHVSVMNSGVAELDALSHRITRCHSHIIQKLTGAAVNTEKFCPEVV